MRKVTLTKRVSTARGQTNDHWSRGIYTSLHAFFYSTQWTTGEVKDRYPFASVRAFRRKL